MVTLRAAQLVNTTLAKSTALARSTRVIVSLRVVYRIEVVALGPPVNLPGCGDASACLK
jgi:hypothetical protein